MIRFLRIVVFTVLMSLVLWQCAVRVLILRYPSDFVYRADVISLDNFYDEFKKNYLGSQISKTQFYYETIADKNNVLTIRNVFDVRRMSGEKIFIVERIYGIDVQSGAHVKSSGDRAREGFLFAPRNLKKQDYIYWHVNYDTPVLMKFQGEEFINGLKVYRYAADFNADQTNDLKFLPGVPEEKGVNLDIHLEQWIEPYSGYMVKYEDNAVCYYYDQFTKKRLYPWNKFNNRYSSSSIKEQVMIAKTKKGQIIFDEVVVPFIFCGGVVLLLILSFYVRRSKSAIKS